MVKFDSKSKHFAALRFAVSAVGKKPSNYALRFLLSEPGGDIVGCDGQRIHIYHSGGGLEPGLYAVDSSTKAQIVLCKLNDVTGNEYPDWKRAIRTDQTDPFEPLLSADNYSCVAAQLIRSLPPDQTINLEYLSDALKSPMTQFRVHPKGGITLIGTNTEALIMSLKCM